MKPDNDPRKRQLPCYSLEFHADFLQDILGVCPGVVLHLIPQIVRAAQ
jgi:hypothetical protein